MVYTFDNEYVACIIEDVDDPTLPPVCPPWKPETQTAYRPSVVAPPRQLRLRGSVKNPSAFSKIVLKAPAPCDRRMSYAGSGLPFPSAEMAFQGSPNVRDLTRPVDGATTAPTDFDVMFEYPNSFYTADRQTLVPPSVFLELTPVASQTPLFVRMELPNPSPLRTLISRGRSLGPEFYAGKEALIGIPESQEAYLRTIGTIKAQGYA